MNWIKVSTAIARDEKLIAIEDDCDVPRAHAVGLVVNVLTMLATERPDGDLTTVRDAALEGWAMWTGKRGRFATAFRAAWTADGRVMGWDKWNGAAIREVRRDRQRKADRKRGAAQLERGVPPEFPRSSPGVPPERDPADTGVPPDVRGKREKESNSSVLTQEEVETSPARAHESLPHAADAAPPAALREASAWVAPHGHAALASLLAHVPDAQEWVGILRGMASGLSMDHNRPCDPGRLAAAIEDFVAKGKHRERTGASPKLFRSFVKSAKAPVTRYPDQQTADEHKAEQLATLRRTNDLRRRTGQPEKPLPAWAAEIDAMFPDGRTFPDLGAP